MTHEYPAPPQPPNEYGPDDGELGYGDAPPTCKKSLQVGATADVNAGAVRIIEPIKFEPPSPMEVRAHQGFVNSYSWHFRRLDTGHSNDSPCPACGGPGCRSGWCTDSASKYSDDSHLFPGADTGIRLGKSAAPKPWLVIVGGILFFVGLMLLGALACWAMPRH